MNCCCVCYAYVWSIKILWPIDSANKSTNLQPDLPPTNTYTHTLCRSAVMSVTLLAAHLDVEAGEASLTVDFEFDWSQVQLLDQSRGVRVVWLQVHMYVCISTRIYIVYGISQALRLASINHDQKLRRCLSDFYCFLSNQQHFQRFSRFVSVYFHLIDIFACLGKFCALFICWISAVKPKNSNNNNSHSHPYHTCQ